MICQVLWLGGTCPRYGLPRLGPPAGPAMIRTPCSVCRRPSSTTAGEEASHQQAAGTPAQAAATGRSSRARPKGCRPKVLHWVGFPVSMKWLLYIVAPHRFEESQSPTLSFSGKEAALQHTMEGTCPISQGAGTSKPRGSSELMSPESATEWVIQVWIDS